MEEHLQALSVTIYFLNAVPFVALHSKCHNTAAVLFNTYIAGRTTFMLYIYTYIYIYIWLLSIPLTQTAGERHAYKHTIVTTDL